MQMIVAADKNWAIGYRGKLLVQIPADMELFRRETVGKVVVMGRKTLESLPGGQPLAKRTNIVLTTQKNYHPKGVIVVQNMEEARQMLEQYRSDDVYIIGGGHVYEQFLPFVDTVHVTKIDYAYQADVYFPNLDQDEKWVMEEESEEQTYFDLEYYFQKYVRKA
ncbi:MAG: dihydrofolate reductase [Clostridiales bacterium]|nr:dihydrofolate reductase [Clostridiales bacterium]